MFNVVISKAPLTRLTSIFSEAIMVVLLPNNFKVSSITPYDGKRDLVAHVEVFYSWMDFEGFRAS